MKFKYLIGHNTSAGPMFIAQTSNGRYHPVWKDESLGSYRTLIGAVEDVAGGHVFTPSDGTRTGSLGLSSDPSDWVDARDLM